MSSEGEINSPEEFLELPEFTSMSPYPCSIDRTFLPIQSFPGLSRPCGYTGKYQLFFTHILVNGSYGELSNENLCCEKGRHSDYDPKGKYETYFICTDGAFVNNEGARTSETKSREEGTMRKKSVPTGSIVIPYFGVLLRGNEFINCKILFNRENYVFHAITHDNEKYFIGSEKIALAPLINSSSRKIISIVDSFPLLACGPEFIQIRDFIARSDADQQLKIKKQEYDELIITDNIPELERVVEIALSDGKFKLHPYTAGYCLSKQSPLKLIEGLTRNGFEFPYVSKKSFITLMRFIIEIRVPDFVELKENTQFFKEIHSIAEMIDILGFDVYSEFFRNISERL